MKDKDARERYQSLSKEENDEKQQYGRKWYKSLPENEKQKLAGYRKKYKMRENALL